MKSKEILNKRERAILKFIEKVINEQGYPPSVREIGKAVGLSSTATVYHYLIQLDQKQYIERQEKKGRTLKLLKNERGEEYENNRRCEYPNKYLEEKEMVEIPIIGETQKGKPVLAVENVTGTFTIPVEYIGNSEAFMMTSKNDHMEKAGILDGDLVIIKKQANAINGEMVAVVLDGENLTIKTFYKEKSHIRLQPESDEIQPILVNDCKIEGVVIGVFRKV